MSWPDWRVRPFTVGDQHAARRLILAGLGEHVGAIDETRNPDLDDIWEHYSVRGDLFVVVQAGATLIETGAIQADPDGPAGQSGWIVRVSVARLPTAWDRPGGRRASGTGRSSARLDPAAGRDQSRLGCGDPAVPALRLPDLPPPPGERASGAGLIWSPESNQAPARKPVDRNGVLVGLELARETLPDQAGLPGLEAKRRDLRGGQLAARRE